MPEAWAGWGREKLILRVLLQGGGHTASEGGGLPPRRMMPKEVMRLLVLPTSVTVGEDRLRGVVANDYSLSEGSVLG
ncbi:hypothetical protein C1Y63_10725 [Corynebacterium sp. 13CS0277]|nr:hypothetical protein C1Y63_10725 [Corynebacterium sp. 13CS0277]